MLRFFAVLAAIAVCLRLSFLEFDKSIYYTILFVCSMYIMIIKLIGNNLKLNLKFLVFVLFLLLTIILNDIPVYYRPYQRLSALIIMFVIVGPFILGQQSIYIRNYIFKYLIIILIVSQFISFILYVTNSPIAFHKTKFNGVFSHSMIMGPIAAIICLYAIFSLKFYKKRKIIFISVFVISLLNMFLASSRSALLAFITSCVMLLYFYSSNKLKFSRNIAIILILLLSIIPYIPQFFEGLIMKMEFGSDNGDILYSRRFLWATRISEIESSPLFGIGYSNDTRVNDTIDGTVEPGSSWLSILSMIGILGLVMFIVILFSSIKKSTNNMTVEIQFLLSVIIFFMVHFFFEGYVLASGSGLAFIFWLTLGLLNDKKYMTSTN